MISFVVELVLTMFWFHTKMAETVSIQSHKRCLVFISIIWCLIVGFSTGNHFGQNFEKTSISRKRFGGF